MIRTEEYNYNLPKELIAESAVSPRDKSRLLVFNSQENTISDKLFSDLAKYIEPDDLLVINNSKVMPARILGKKKSGGKIEVLLIEDVGEGWDVIIGGKISAGDVIIFDQELQAEVINRSGKEGIVKFNLSGDKFWQKIEILGSAPIPPYIKDNHQSRQKLISEYQTVFAAKYGSAAAPTAGLHFTQQLLDKLETKGTHIATVDLHVGLGTFAPLEEKNIVEKNLHSEKISIPKDTVDKIIDTKSNNKKIFAVGTTTIRALESAKKEILSGPQSISSSTEIFIQPGDKFEIADALITNFHLPRSSLMMLVAAFLEQKGAEDGREKLLEIYQHAIDNKYRFYSFGDAMLIL